MSMFDKSILRSRVNNKHIFLFTLWSLLIAQGEEASVLGTEFFFFPFANWCSLILSEYQGYDPFVVGHLLIYHLFT